MNLFGFEITRKKGNAIAPNSSATWSPLIRESFAGAWQRNIVVNRDTVLSYSASFACITLIASDIAKLDVCLKQENPVTGICVEITSPAFSPVLRKPNHYQNSIQFFQQWMVSKLAHGNTYALKERDNRNIVKALYILDPQRCRPLVAPDGSIFYELYADYLSGLEAARIVVPASEIIHDTNCPLFHPLVGISPIYACGLSAMQGVAIQTHSAAFFQNSARPGGILTAPGAIQKETAERLKTYWDENFTGEKAGRVAVLGDGLKFEAMVMTAEASQMIEQLKLSAETVCSCFHVPPYMVGAGPVPPYGNIEALSQIYLGQCLQTHIESIESLLEDGLALPSGMEIEFDLDGLLRMDYATKVKSTIEGIGGGLFAPDEGRKKFDLPPVEGGASPYLQQQNFSLAALAKRDAKDDPFASTPKPTPVAPVPALPPAVTPPAKAADEIIDAEFSEVDYEIAALALSSALKALPAPMGIA